MTINKSALVRNNNAQKNERPHATLWLNIGYLSDVLDENGEAKFVSLAQGIPLDTIEDLPVRGKNMEWNNFQSARNDLRDQLIEIGNQLEPGECQYFDTDSTLIIQLRKVEVENVAPSSTLNPFLRKLV